ncbi:MAG: LUD domain-containing protein [Ignavibacteriaceae bacterium]|jgi:L-lactate dehydrogenase complex protein LldG
MGVEFKTDIIEQFISSAKNTTATVERIHSDAESLNNSLIAASGEEMVLLAKPDYINTELFSIFKSNKNIITNPSKDLISRIKIGITDAFCAVASTGSVCVSITNSLSGIISMLVTKHIVVVDSKTIIPRPRDIFSEEYLNNKILKSNFSIITGPSATADMGPLVRGVHGPGKLHIIILE